MTAVFNYQSLYDAPSALGDNFVDYFDITEAQFGFVYSMVFLVGLSSRIGFPVRNDRSFSLLSRVLPLLPGSLAELRVFLGGYSRYFHSLASFTQHMLCFCFHQPSLFLYFFTGVMVDRIGANRGSLFLPNIIDRCLGLIGFIYENIYFLINLLFSYSFIYLFICFSID